jgi:hypothetical protein
VIEAAKHGRIGDVRGGGRVEMKNLSHSNHSSVHEQSHEKGLRPPLGLQFG